MDRNHWEVTVDGHAGYAENGKDIVCAAASMLTATLIRSLMGVTGMEAETPAPGKAHIVCNPTLGEAAHVAEVFDVIDTGYQLLSSSYPVHVRYTKHV
jgi:uncharacterized protein YsxB (DUF464 family)